MKLALLNGGTGAGDASSVVKGGGEDLTRATGQVKRGDVQASKSTINLHQLKSEQTRAEVARLTELKKAIEEKIADNAKLQAMGSQILLEMTPDGLRIQIVDSEGRPMFASGSPTVQPGMRELLRTVGSVLSEVPNRLTLEGHTDALPFGSTERGYSNWELSSDRANASRRELLAGGLQEDHVLRVQGLAASNPFDRKDPTAPANRRISIIVMTRAAEDRLFRTAPEAEPEPPAAPATPGLPALPNPSPNPSSVALPAEAPPRSSTAASRR
jgi:chemotaxis protein MotB